jgi:hypothetical protein
MVRSKIGLASKSRPLVDIYSSACGARALPGRVPAAAIKGNLRRCATTYPTAGSQDGRRVIVQAPSAGRLEAERDAP